MSLSRPPSRAAFTLRVTTLAVIALLMPACGSGGGRRLEQTDAGRDVASVLPGAAGTCSPLAGDECRAVDILFAIDSSTSMRPLQAKLRANFPAFMQVLRSFPNGLPNLHVGVVTADMGAGPFTEIPQCRPGGDGGELQGLPGPLAEAGCSPPEGKFISDATSVGGAANYRGSLEDVFSCIAAVGDSGCGFESPLGSVLAALDQSNTKNKGFLRPDASLAIIFLTNEDDCTVRDPLFYDPSSRSVQDTYGPLTSFRCSEYGHLCRGAAPSRTADSSFAPGECVSNEGGMMLPVAEAVATLKGLKADPRKILIAALAGPPDPYRVRLTTIMNPATATAEAQPLIDHSCTEPTADPAMPEYADPGVRLSQLVSAFGKNGLYSPICAADFSPALALIAQRIGQMIGELPETGGTGGATGGSGGATGGSGGATGGGVTVDYKAGAPQQNAISFSLNIRNGGAAAVELSRVKVRYWFTSEYPVEDLAFDSYYAGPVGISSLVPSFSSVSPPRTGADRYLELGFVSGTGSLDAVVGQTGEIMVTIHTLAYEPMVSTDDYSYDETKSVFESWDHITAYVDGVLVFGVEP